MSAERHVHVLKLPLVFPAGLSAGEGREGSRMFLARDGQGRPVLRGTALAGVLRHAYARLRGDKLAAAWFGASPIGKETPTPSPLRVPDIVLMSEITGAVLTRQHNAMDRHVGAVSHGALFSLEALPPGIGADVRLVLDTAGTAADDGPRTTGHRPRRFRVAAGPAQPRVC